MDEQRFLDACEAAISPERAPGGIGTLGERTLHMVLKRYFEPDESLHEINVGGFVADIARPDGIIEIQTRGMNKLQKKLEAFLELHRVTVVYPVAAVKRLRWIDTETGEVTAARRSPKRGALYDALPELYYIRRFITHPNFRLCVVLLELEELRYLSGWSRDKKRGSERYDRVPQVLADEVYFSKPEDYRKMLPEGLELPFTVREFSRAAKRSLYQSGLALGALRAAGAVSVVAKKGNAFVYDFLPVDDKE